jgi:UDP-2,3-diacylglucosamine pyrophosphatase LpxH
MDFQGHGATVFIGTDMVHSSHRDIRDKLDSSKQEGTRTYFTVPKGDKDVVQFPKGHTGT